MAVNKVIYGGRTVMDLTGDTVTPATLLEGVTAHDKTGASITGTNPYEKTATDAAVTAISTAIAGKGVTVPDGTKLDGMAALIESIVAGGGEMQFVSGEFTPTSIDLYNNPITISGIGFKPKILCVIVSSVSTFGALGKTYGRYLGSYFVHENGSGYAGRSAFGDNQSSLTDSGLGVISHGYYFIINITDDGFTLSGQYANCYTYKKKYVYYAFG